MPTFSGIVVATGTEAEGRRTLLDVINELARPVDASDSTILGLAADAFRAAVRTMNRKGLWPWEIQDEDITIATNERFYTVNGAIKKPLALHYLDEAGGTRDQQIWYMSYDRFVETYNLDFAGEAHTYTIPNLFETGQLRLFPVPSSDDNARFTYYRVTPPPKLEQEAVEIPDHAIEPYMALAWAEFLKRLPSQQRPFPISVAVSEARTAFRELSAHVASPGDRTRQVSGGYGFG